MNPFEKLWKFIQERDGKKEGENENLPLFHEAINLKSFDTPQYHSWNNSNVPIQLSNLISAEYKIFINNDFGNKAITFNQTPQYSGIHINCRQLSFDNVDYKYFLVHISQKLIKQQYKKSLAEAKSERKNNNISTYYNFYLKPNLLRLEAQEDGKMPQFYGNVLMKYETVNERPHQLTITINRYSDFKYKEAISFSEFIESVFPRK